MINKSFREYFNLLNEDSISRPISNNQKAFHTQIDRYSNHEDNIGKVFVCVETNTNDSLPIGIIGECIDVILGGRYLKFKFSNHFYNAQYFRELKNTFGYTAEELREIEWIEGFKIVDIENNVFTQKFLNSPLSNKALDKILQLHDNKEPFIKNFNHQNSYHRLVMDIAIKDNLK